MSLITFAPSPSECGSRARLIRPIRPSPLGLVKRDSRLGTEGQAWLGISLKQFWRNSGMLFKGTVKALVLALFVSSPVVIMFATLWGLSAARWFTYDRHFGRIHVTAAPDRKQCADADKPILVEIKNGSSRTVVESSFWLNATRPESSFDLSNGGEWNRNLIPSGATLKICTPAVLIGNHAGEDHQSFLWNAGLSWVRFEE
jgi:hypothetical protein